jgi:hypothetical protein
MSFKSKLSTAVAAGWFRGINGKAFAIIAASMIIAACMVCARAAISGCVSLRMRWIKLQSPSRELTLWGAYVGRSQYTLSCHSGAMKWACSTKLSGSAEPSTPLREFESCLTNWL